MLTLGNDLTLLYNRATSSFSKTLVCCLNYPEIVGVNCLVRETVLDLMMKIP